MPIFSELLVKINKLFSNPDLLNSVLNNRFLLIFFVIILMRAKYATYRSMWFSAVVNIPGTFLHELSHFLVGLFLNARPCDFTILPRRNEYGDYVMGSVGFRNITFYNAIPSSLAPLSLLILGFFINRHFLPLMKPTFLNYMLYILVQTIIIENSIPSRADFRIATSRFLGIVLYLILFAALLMFI